MAKAIPRNIYIIGAQCTGKTTLLENLKNHYAQEQPNIISEVARGVIKELNFERENIVDSPSQSFRLQKAILQAQFERETLFRDTTTSWYISDRSGIDPIVYARYYVGVEKADELLTSPYWTYLEQQMKASLVVLCEAGVHWLTDDGIRLMPKDEDDWITFGKAFHTLLEERNVRYIVIPNNLTEINDRAAAVVEAHARGEST